MLTVHCLNVPRSDVAAARERLEQAAAALARGQAAYSAANDRMRFLDDEDARRASEYAVHVEQAAANGTAPIPYLEVLAPDAAERHRAQIEARGAAEALEHLKSAHAAAQVAVTAAEQALRVAVDQALDARAVELMEAAEKHLHTLEGIGAELAALLPDTRFETAAGLPSEPAARDLLKRLPLVPRSDLDTPINELRDGGARVSRLAEMRAELMSTAIEQPTQVAA